MLSSKLQNANLKSSSKSSVVSSSPQLSKRIVDRLGKEGLGLQHSRSCKDLGIEAAAGKRRAMKTLQKRSSKAKLKLAKLSLLRKMAPANVRHKTARFQTTNLWPVASYGLEAHGIPKRALHNLRVSAAKTVQDTPGQ